MKKIIAVTLSCTIIMTMFCSCTSKQNKNLDISRDVSLTLCGPWPSSKAIEMAMQMFSEKYPNCEMEYEYVQNYIDSVTTRLANQPQSIDLFLTENIQNDSPHLQYAEDLFSHKELDLSDTNDALIKNFTLINTNDNELDKLYSIPLGGEMRGIFVNKTLLSSLDLSVPKNVDELLNCCKVLKDAGYVPMNGNPGMYGQRLMYPYICNIIANSKNYTETYNSVNNCEQGVSELFRQPLELLYKLTENNYYNYKYVETELNMFTDNSDEGCSRYFFNVLANGDDFVKEGDIGRVAFMVGALSQQTTMQKIKEDYHSKIDFDFILAPVSEEGGFAYISPAKGIAVNKNSANLDWAIEFLNFIYTEDVNIKFADAINFIPNTKDSFKIVRKKFDVSNDRISNLGQVTFKYGFYNIMQDSLVSISKANNPKYMDKDKNGNAVMFSFDYYMNKLEDDFVKQRESEVINDESRQEK